MSNALSNVSSAGGAANSRPRTGPHPDTFSREPLTGFVESGMEPPQQNENPLAQQLIPNIGPLEIRKRKAIGYAVLAIAVGALGLMVLGGAPVITRLILAPFWWLGTLGLLQARMKTCVALAGQGVCNLDDGPEPIRDPEILAAVQRQARNVHRWSLAAAVALTVLSILPPAL